jgi:hypothetical protein
MKGTKMKIGILGSGAVGQSLAGGFLKYGHDVKIGTSNPKKLEQWKQGPGAKASLGSFADAASFGELLVLAVKGSAAESVVTKLGAAALAGKIIIDATNPIADVPPENGVLKFFISMNESLMERLQTLAPAAHFVKAFSCIGNAFMVNPQFPGGPPTMFICGNNDAAKGTVKKVLDQFGWVTEDMGSAVSARAIEPLCILWCIPGMQKNQWTHAFKLLKI